MDEIELVDYDPRWPSLFDHEARRLRSVFDPHLIVGLEHFGSARRRFREGERRTEAASLKSRHPAQFLSQPLTKG